MTLVILPEGQAVTKFAKPADTNAATIYTVPGAPARARLVGLNISGDVTSGAATVWINDGSTDWLVLDAKAISANTTEVYDFGHPILSAGHSVKVKTSAASKITFALTVSEMLSR